MSNLLNNVLAPTNNLCFNYHEFTKDSFSVDQFLQEHRNMANLETMRDDLGIYLKTLRSAMIELINKDYADFVNLSTNLIGLDKAISNIQLPLGQLKEELIMVQNNIEDALTEVSTQLLRRKKIQERKRSLKSLNRVQCSLKKLNLLLIEVATKADKESKLLQLERAGMEFSQLQFHASQCGGDLSSSHKQSLEDIGKRLYDEVNIQFVECFNNKKDNHLVRTLEIYLTLDKCSQAEESFRKTKVAPVMKQLISEEALAGNPKGLGGLYDSLIEFIDKEMKVLQKVTQSSDRFSSVKGFDFVVNSYWPEVEERLEMHLPSIYAPGNPDNFFVSYSETLQFIEKLESKCNNKPLHEHPQYQSFMHRWNLPVYFQIRFQEIAGGVEGALMSFETSYSSADWKLIATKTVWESLLRCWADKVFITQLTHRFWKLNLQILARYHSWSNELVEKKTEDVQLEVWVCLYSDLVMLSDRLEELFTHIKHRLHSKISQNLLNDLKKCIEEWKLNLVSQLSTVSARLVKSVSAESLAALRQVSEVPRLYRRTNREAPTRSLPYIDVMLKAPLAFHLSHKDHSHTTVWIQSIFSEITKQYYIAVMDVLTSVQKTDDSLRRLKKIRDRSMASGSIPDRGGDGDKIRMQLYFDANYYCKKIEDIGVRKDSVEQLNDLLKLVETLQVKMGLNNP